MPGPESRKTDLPVSESMRLILEIRPSNGLGNRGGLSSSRAPLLRLSVSRPNGCESCGKEFYVMHHRRTTRRYRAFQKRSNLLILLAPRPGLEPGTCPLGGGRAIQLCHRGEGMKCTLPKRSKYGIELVIFTCFIFSVSGYNSMLRMARSRT